MKAAVVIASLLVKVKLLTEGVAQDFAKAAEKIREHLRGGSGHDGGGEERSGHGENTGRKVALQFDLQSDLSIVCICGDARIHRCVYAGIYLRVSCLLCVRSVHIQVGGRRRVRSTVVAS